MDRLCHLCLKDIPEDKVLNAHHISYEPEVKANLCYMCHCLIHARLKFHNPYDKFGRDYSAYYMAKDILRIFARHPALCAKLNDGRVEVPKDKQKAMIAKAAKDIAAERLAIKKAKGKSNANDIPDSPVR